MRSMLSKTAKTIRPRFASLNSLPDATRMPPKTYKIVAMRKYAPIPTNGKEGPPAAPGGLVPVTFAGGLTDDGLIIDPKKRASGA